MKRILTTLALLLWAIPAFAQVPMTGAGKGKPGAAVAFQGIGDVKTTGWKAVYGTSAFSAATRGTKLINACDSTGGVDVSCADMLSDATTGDIVPQVIGGITCPSANCTVKIWYDLSGQTLCTTACDMTQATVASRAKLTSNAIGTKTCGVSTGSANYASPNLVSPIIQPFNVTGVVKYSNTTGSQQFFSGGAGSNIGFGAFSATFAFFASSGVTGATFDTSPHAIQYIGNFASSFVVVDTSTGTTQNSGGSQITGGVPLGLFTDTFSQRINGAMCQMGLNAGTAWNGTDATNLYNNEHTYWGF